MKSKNAIIFAIKLFPSPDCCLAQRAIVHSKRLLPASLGIDQLNLRELQVDQEIETPFDLKEQSGLPA